MPVITLIAGVLFRKEIPSRLQVFGAVLSVIGVAVISLTQQRGSNEAGRRGISVLRRSIKCGYNLLMRDTADSFTSFERTYVMLGLGSLFLPVFQ
ncbi:MAG: EamA family transporter [Eisenbergiella sp.]